MGRAERTENDPQFAVLSDKTDKTKNYTEKFVKVGKHCCSHAENLFLVLQ